MSNVSISSIIDQSGTMVSYNYLEAAKTDAATFITIMKDSDQIGVVAFSTTSRVIYPLNTIRSDHTTIKGAIKEITKLKGLNLTNIKQAISQGYGMLTQAEHPTKAMILISDGLWNTGGDPLPGLLTDIPIHTIAIGDQGQLAFLNTLAQKTGGKFHFSPNANRLAEIYNQIAGDTNVAQTVINRQQQIQSYHFTTLPMQIPAGTTHTSLAINWIDNSISYTPGTPGKDQVNVLLKDPDGKRVDMAPTFKGSTYVTFHLHDPKPGQWTTGCWCGNITQNIFIGTVGAFEPNSNITLKCLTGNDVLSCGDFLNFKTTLETGGEELGNLNMKICLESPVHSMDHLFEKYEKKLQDISPDEKLLERGMDENHARLTVLHQKLLPHTDIYARRQMPLGGEYSEGEIKCEPVGLDVPGSHTVRVDVEGDLPESNTRFTRTQRFSVHVD